MLKGVRGFTVLGDFGGHFGFASVVWSSSTVSKKAGCLASLWLEELITAHRQHIDMMVELIKDLQSSVEAASPQV